MPFAGIKPPPEGFSWCCGAPGTGTGAPLLPGGGGGAEAISASFFFDWILSLSLSLPFVLSLSFSGAYRFALASCVRRESGIPSPAGEKSGRTKRGKEQVFECRRSSGEHSIPDAHFFFPSVGESVVAIFGRQATAVFAIGNSASSFLSLSLSAPSLFRPLTMPVPLRIAAAPGNHATAAAPAALPRRHTERTTNAVLTSTLTSTAVAASRRCHRSARRTVPLRRPIRLPFLPAASEGGSDTVNRGERRAGGQMS